MSFNVPDPDEVDIFVHNHNVLNRLGWVMLGLAIAALYYERYFAVVTLLAMVVTLRSMSRLLCGWIHAWAALWLATQKNQHPV